MKEHQQIIDGLERLKRDEIHAGEYYLSAAREAEHRGEEEQQKTYLAIRKVHGELALMFDHRRETLEKEAGEGILGDTIHAFVDAMRALVNMSVLFFESETPMTPKSLIEIEQELKGRYGDLLEAADPTTTELLQRAIQANERNIRQVQNFVEAGV